MNYQIDFCGFFLSRNHALTGLHSHHDAGISKKNDIDPHKWLTDVIMNTRDSNSYQLKHLLLQYFGKTQRLKTGLVGQIHTKQYPYLCK